MERGLFFHIIQVYLSTEKRYTQWLVYVSPGLSQGEAHSG